MIPEGERVPLSSHSQRCPRLPRKLQPECSSGLRLRVLDVERLAICRTNTHSASSSGSTCGSFTPANQALSHIGTYRLIPFFSTNPAGLSSLRQAKCRHNPRSGDRRWQTLEPELPDHSRARSSQPRNSRHASSRARSLFPARDTIHAVHQTGLAVGLLSGA